MNNNTFAEVKEAVENWWHQLQYERKCSSTYSVQKLVNNCSEEVQQQVRQLISCEIKNCLEKCYRTRHLNDYQHLCSALNGCFDNFVYAADAVRNLFLDVVKFIHFGLNECRTNLSLKNSQKNATMELFHSFSRVLILVLKLNRTQNVAKQSNSSNCTAEDIEELSGLSGEIGQFLMMDDVLIETKNNFAMAGILIREILSPDEEKLIQFHKSFIETISGTVSEKNLKLNVLKFLTCSAIINTWSVKIIDSDSTYYYLKFFIFLCEEYSSETAIVLNTSRTLFLLIKHDSFKNFINNGNWHKVKQIISMLLSCIFMLLEHPVSCVRHSAKNFLQLLANHPSVHALMIDSVFQLPTDKRSYFISVGVLANEIGTDVLIEKNHSLRDELISSLSDPTIVSHVSLCLEYVIMKDSLTKRNFSEWCETWIVPLLISLMKALPIIGADIEKLLEKAFKKYPNTVVYVIDKWANPASEEELRYVITALKISQRQGLKISRNCCSLNDDPSRAMDNKENYLVNERLLEHCLSQRDDDIRISAFSLLIEAHKSTKIYAESDFRLILHFLKYNLNNQQPAARQKILGLMRKMLVRFSDSKAAFLKSSKKIKHDQEMCRNSILYDDFMNSLVNFCFSNIFIGCNFNRLNTVLNILLLCFENVKDMKFDPQNVVTHWGKFLIALDSSYEENKELAVVLAKKLELSLLDANKIEEANLLFEKAFNLCTHMEPPDVLTGAYLVQLLTNFPIAEKTLRKYFTEKPMMNDVCFYTIKILGEKLKEQIHLAQLDLMTAATCGPMYGILFAIRLILKGVHFSSYFDQPEKMEQWGEILNDLIELSFKMTGIVGCVVNSSSPEGHLPNDFQTDFENLNLNLHEEYLNDGAKYSSSEVGTNSYIHLLKSSCSYFFQKFNTFMQTVEKDNVDAYESLRRLKALLKENILLSKKVKSLKEVNDSFIEDAIAQLDQVGAKLHIYIGKMEQTKSVPEWPASAQVLLLCAWRTIKEASLYLGDLITKLPMETGISVGLITEAAIIKIGEELKVLLCEIKHRGAFEHVYVGFTQLVNSLWNCTDKNLSILPRTWLEDILKELETPLKDQKMKLCSTRRSAGLPFLVQAIICSEIVSVKSSTPSSLHSTMKSLFRIIENGVPENPESKIHALNILRALFKHAQLGEHVASYVSKGLKIAICGSRGATWSERNSSSLLFSSLMIRVFGVARSRDEISKKNRMTSRTFFQRYSELYNFLLSEMELVYSEESLVGRIYPKPSLYLVLLILGRLYPPPTEDPENLDLSEFLPYINRSRKNATMKIRELGAKALVPLISLDRLHHELNNRFSLLSLQNAISQNEMHGILLQIKELLTRSSEGLNVTEGNLCLCWLENSKWILTRPSQLSFVILRSYVKVLHILFKKLPPLRVKIAEIINTSTVVDEFHKLSDGEKRLLPGIFVFLENYYFVKCDVIAHTWHESGDDHGFLELFLFMINCGVSEVQSIPLRILCHLLEVTEASSGVEEDDFSGIGVAIDDLLVFQSIKNIEKLHFDILHNAAILKSLSDPLSEENCEFFKSRVIHRSWLSIISNLIMSGKIPIPKDSTFRRSIKCLMKSGDKDLSTSALMCHAVILMEEVSLSDESGLLSQNRLELADILEDFSEPEADVKERLVVARILNHHCDSFIKKVAISDPSVMRIWMIPFKLLADEDLGVRTVASAIVYKIQEHVLSKTDTFVKSNSFDSLHLPSVSLKAQENLLDSYVNILGEENLVYLVVQMLRMALSSLCDKNEESFSKDEFGVFEKGNPNPYCEHLTLSDLMCQKLAKLKSSAKLDVLMKDNLNESLSRFLKECFQLPSNPKNLMEVLETLSSFFNNKEKMKDFSLPRIQVGNLKKAVG